LRSLGGRYAVEEFLDAVSDGLVWGTGFSVAMLAVRSMRFGLRPVVRGTVRGAVAANKWVRSTAAEGGDRLQDIYHEAKAEQDSGTVPQPGA
jgi:hypothetical protein